jgi:hypothetical protein
MRVKLMSVFVLGTDDPAASQTSVGWALEKSVKSRSMTQWKSESGKWENINREP